MIYKNRALLFIVSFLIFGFFLLSVAREGFSGNGGTLGCCFSPPGEENRCFGCEEFCAITQDECGENGFAEGLYCYLPTGTQSCTTPGPTEGCCLLFPGSCQDAHTIDTCEAATGIAWFFDTACSEVPQCTPQIPTFNQWGKIITMAAIGVFAVMGFIIMRRRNSVSSE